MGRRSFPSGMTMSGAGRTRAMLVILGAIIVLRLAMSWREWAFKVRLQREVAERDLARTHAMIAAAPARLDSVRRVRSELRALSDSFLVAGTAAQAAAALSSAVTDRAAASNIALGTTDVRVDTTSGRVLRTASLQAEATGRFDDIVSFMAAVESGDEVLALRRTSITVAPGEGGGNGVVRMRFTVIGTLVTPSLASR